jgi:putative transposase
MPNVPLSHPFVERLIGSFRRELLDHTFFWTATDLENKLRSYQNFFNEGRTHSGRNGTTPKNPESEEVIDINEYRWQKHCRGLFHLPIAAQITNSPGTGMAAPTAKLAAEAKAA